MRTPRKTQEKFPTLIGRIRMYKVGLGDCFLISIPSGLRTFNILIDCGTYARANATSLIQKVAQDIYQTTLGHLDLVVVTHVHWDHLSGFFQAREIFDQCRIDQIWLPWSENPGSAEALTLSEVRSRKVSTLWRVAEKLYEGNPRQRDRIQNILRFFGEPPEADRESFQYQSAVDCLISHPHTVISYLDTTFAPVSLRGLEGVRFFILSPYSTLKPSISNTEYDEGLAGYFGGGQDNNLFVLSSLEMASGLSGQDSAYLPFDTLIPRDSDVSVERSPFFEDRYGITPDDPQAWRRIDQDWQKIANNQAVGLDYETNNNSLALAIELTETGQVLFFPGDAELSAWQQWEGLSWSTVTALDHPVMVTVRDLFARTVLYKVAHHGSLFGTPRQGGLELLKSQNLVAMLSVDQNEAIRNSWDLPNPRLYQRLMEKTRGRLLRSDLASPQLEAMTRLSDIERKDFLDSINQTDLYLEYALMRRTE